MSPWSLFAGLDEVKAHTRRKYTGKKTRSRPDCLGPAVQIVRLRITANYFVWD